MLLPFLSGIHAPPSQHTGFEYPCRRPCLPPACYLLVFTLVCWVLPPLSDWHTILHPGKRDDSLSGHCGDRGNDLKAVNLYQWEMGERAGQINLPSSCLPETAPVCSPSLQPGNSLPCHFVVHYKVVFNALTCMLHCLKPSLCLILTILPLYIPCEVRYLSHCHKLYGRL